MRAGSRAGSAREDAVRVFVCLSVPSDIKVHETGVTSSTRLGVKAVLSRGAGTTRGAERP